MLKQRPGHPASSGLASRLLVTAIALLLVYTGHASAFPFLDATNADQVPQGTELAAPDVRDLQHQLQLVNGLGAPAGGGWTFIPRIDGQEELTDNVFQAHSPRLWDLVTFVSPGFTLAGELPRIQMSLDFAPTLSLYARNSDLNSLTEQVNGIASITLVPDLFYVDVRAVAGVHSLYGGLGGIGGVGAPAGGLATAQAGIPTLAGNAEGLNKDNEVQTTSFAVSPYLLRRFGDWGTAKLGYSAAITESDTLSGFFAPPFPTGGANASTLLTNEELATFTTGDFLQFVQDFFSIDLTQTQTTTGTGVVNIETGVAPTTTQNTSSTRDIISDRLTYQVNRSLSVFVSGGHEDIHYTGVGAQSIDDLIWSLGATLTPSPNSQLTVSYGHQNGANSLSATGYYALTARTLLTVSYGTTLGSQLENVQNQLNLAAPGFNATTLNVQNGGTLYGATNALGVEEGIFRTTTLTVGSQTTLDRDIFSLNLLMAKQTSTGVGPATSADSKTISVGWIHQMRPDMTISAAISYAIQDQTTGVISTANPGNNTSIAASLAWQWQISETISTSLRYSFVERQSPVTIYETYQNIILLGVSKRF